MKDAKSPALSYWLAKKGRESRDRDKKKAEVLIMAALNLAREPKSAEAYRAGKAALKAAFGQGFRVKRDDVLKILLAAAIFFSSED